MPLARIITRVQEDADELANDLRGRGFEIEIVAPDHVPAHSVDLEVRLEECATEDALASAENTPQPQDVCVFIAPGALVETARPMVVVPLFSEPVVGPIAPERHPVAEEVTVRAETPLAELVTSLQDEHAVTASEIESPAITQTDQELYEDPAAVVLEGEAVPEPLFEASPSGAAVPARIKFPRRLRVRIKHSDRVFWRVALAMAILAVGGLLTLSAHRHSPLPSALGSSPPSPQQAAPFAGAKVQKITLPTNPAAATPPPTITPDPKPSPASQAVEVRPHARASQRTVAFKPKHSTRNPESDFVAADTVVHFGKRAAVAQPKAPKDAGIKHYTDLK